MRPLYRYRPNTDDGTRPFHLDSHEPKIPVREFALAEARFATLARSDPERAEQLLELAQADADARWHYYEQLAEIERKAPPSEHDHGSS